MPKIDLKIFFTCLQEQLALKLEGHRQHACHPSAKGDATELNWVGMLREHLPARYATEKAFVVDADGEVSEQLDVVIFDRQYCPVIFNQDGLIYVPAESVYVVLEVKQTINKELIKYAGKKAASVRRLRRTSAPIPHAGGVYPAKQHFRILAGLLALECDWTAGLGPMLAAALQELPEGERLDIGCSLRHGSFEVYYPDCGAPEIRQSEPDSALVFFLLRLLHRLQELGTVPAVDLQAYTAALEVPSSSGLRARA